MTNWEIALWHKNKTLDWTLYKLCNPRNVKYSSGFFLVWKDCSLMMKVSAFPKACIIEVAYIIMPFRSAVMLFK